MKFGSPRVARVGGWPFYPGQLFSISEVLISCAKQNMLLHCNYHSTQWINFNHRSIYSDNIATRAPCQVRLTCLRATDHLNLALIKFKSSYQYSYQLITIKVSLSRNTATTSKGSASRNSLTLWSRRMFSGFKSLQYKTNQNFKTMLLALVY